MRKFSDLNEASFSDLSKLASNNMNGAESSDEVLSNVFKNRLNKGKSKTQSKTIKEQNLNPTQTPITPIQAPLADANIKVKSSNDISKINRNVPKKKDIELAPQKTTNSQGEQTFTKKINMVKQPKSTRDVIEDSNLQIIAKQNEDSKTKEEKKKSVAKRKNKRQEVEKVVEKLDDKQYEVFNDTVSDELSETYDMEIPEGIDVPELENTINAASEEIKGLDPSQMEVKKPQDKTRTNRNYYQAIVHIKPEFIPDEMNKLAAYVKNTSKKYIVPRLTSLRIMTSVNKIQLKSEKDELKLTTKSITLKPKKEVSLKQGDTINRGTRVIVTAPSDYQTSKEFVIYFQEGRKHESVRIKASQNVTIDGYIKYIGNRIIDFYKDGYDTTMVKIKLYATRQPLMPVIEKVLATCQYKVLPILDRDTRLGIDDIIGINIFGKFNKKNQNMFLNIYEGINNGYNITFDEKGKQNDNLISIDINMSKHHNNFYTIDELLNNITDILDKCFQTDLSSEFGFDKDDLKKQEKILGYLSLNQMRKTYKKIFDIIKSQFEDKKSEIKTEITDVVTQRDFKDEYHDDGESIIGHTMIAGNEYCQFKLTYRRLTLFGGYISKDSKTYITSEEYYNLVGTKDKRTYSERRKAIGNVQVKLDKNENPTNEKIGTRNYNDSIYAYILEYVDTIHNKSYTFYDRNFDRLLSTTQFLSDNVRFGSKVVDKINNKPIDEYLAPISIRPSKIKK